MGPVFGSLILEARLAIKKDKGRQRRARPRNNARLRELEARSEIDARSGGFPRRGYDGTAPYSHPAAARSTIGSGAHGQSSHT